MKTETLFGKTVNVVGNVSADLVLESLGKIYIKSRNKALTLDEIISSITSKSGESIASRTTIVDSIIGLEGIKDGDFVYDKVSDILYILVEGELNELINVSTLGLLYVKRTGDTMTGSLTIKTPSGEPPLKVTSSILNKNFNSQYLDSLPSLAYAQKAKDELITGKWTHDNSAYFNSPVYYRDNTMHYKDSIHAGSLGTPDFASGFGGYGWRIDGATNTLTIDYIVVRKAMYVYELVVNKISATNGSLWVSNASKVEYVCQLPIIVGDNPWLSINPSAALADKSIRAAVNGAKNNDGFILTPSLTTLNWTNEQMADNTGYGIPKTDFNYKNLLLVMCDDEARTTEVLLKFSNNNTPLNFLDSDFNDTDVASVYSKYRVFNEYFDDEVVFPIVISKVNWYSDSAGNNDAYTLRYVKTYHKYFSLKAFNLTSNVFYSNLYLVKFDTDNLPVFMPGDLLRCLKFTGEGIKYYDAIVCNKLKDSYFVIQVSEDIMDKTTTITYDDNLLPTTIVDSLGNATGGVGEASVNTKFYDTTGHRSNDILGRVLEGDSLVQIGHLWDVTRLNAVYITSSDDGAPFIDTMSNVNRPDYSVIYNVPTFKTIKLYKKDALPFTGDYYVLSKDNGIETVLYVLLYLVDEEGLLHSWTFEIGKILTRVIIWYKLNGNVYNVDFDTLYTSLFTDELRDSILSNPIRIQEEPILGQTILRFNSYNELLTYILSQISTKNIRYNNLPLNINQCQVELLRAYPNEHTQLLTSYEETPIFTETAVDLLTEDDNTLILESTISNDTIQPTRTTKARFGNLDGIVDSRFSADKLPHGYGLYGENVFLTGEFVLSNGKNVAQFDKDIMALFTGIEMSSVNFANLKLDLRDLLNAVPTYGNLESAGIFLTDNKLIIFGDSILVITTRDELSGDSAPTALFADGKISAKLIEVHDIHSAYGVSGTEYNAFKGNEVYLDTETVDGLVVSYYYYLDGENNRVRLTAEQAEHLSMEYRLYGWHLKSQGDGYLALGAINWDLNGTLNVDGNIYIKYDTYTLDFNGLYISDLYGSNRLIINGYIDNDGLGGLYSGSSYNRMNFYNYSLESLPTYTIDLTNVCNEHAISVNSVRRVIQLNISGSVLEVFYIHYYVSDALTRPGARPDPNGESAILIFYDSNSNLVQIERIYEGNNSINICSEFDNIWLCLDTYQYSGISATVSFTTSNLTSTIGSNFIKFYPSADSMLWVGRDRFNIVYKNNLQLTALELDVDDIYIHKYSAIFDDTNISQAVSNGSIYWDNRVSLTQLLDGGCIYLEWHGELSTNFISLSRLSNKHIFIKCTESGVKGGIGVDQNYPPLLGTIFTFVLTVDSTDACTLQFSHGPVINYGSNIGNDVRSDVTLQRKIIILMYMGEHPVGVNNTPCHVFMKIKE